MKKLICLISAIIMLIALAACEAKEAVAAETPSAEIPPIEAPPAEALPAEVPQNYDPGMGRISLSACPHSLIVYRNEYANSYHLIVYEQLVDREEYLKWSTSYGEDYEKYNIAQFISDYNIPREKFEFVIKYSENVRYQLNYNADAIYGGTANEYYSDKNRDERLRIFYLNSFLFDLKHNLLSYVKDNRPDAYKAWKKRLNETREWLKDPVPEGISENFLTFSGQISRWDIAPFIAEFGIDEAVVRQSLPFSLAEDYNRQSLKIDELFADVASGNFKADEDYILSAAPDIAADAEPEMAIPVEVIQDIPLAP